MRPSRLPLRRFAALLLGLLLPAMLSFGCARAPRMLGGSSNVEMRLDGEQKHEAELPVGSTLMLDMRDPGASGYIFAGTAFDTSLLRLEGIEPSDGGKRFHYTFLALAQGQCDVLVKIRKTEPGYRPDVYKRVRVTITQ